MKTASLPFLLSVSLLLSVLSPKLTTMTSTITSRNITITMTLI